MKYDYAGGVLPHERRTIEHFEDQVIPYIEKHGSQIGERAMCGDADCEEVIRRYRQFTWGAPDFRAECFKYLVSALKRAERNLL